MNNNVRNVTIGLIDGLTIPFALAAGLSNIVLSTHTIFISCLAIIIAYSITMTIGAYMSAQKHEPVNALTSAFTIGVSYIAGGLISVFPFFIITAPGDALKYSSVTTLTALFLAGYLDSKSNNANGWTGAIRVAVTGVVAGAAAYGVAYLFR
ncbi:MAG: VIT1/CCC1 transporter family protein [Chitinophagaceae bacterium]|nr:VIT1/CCC1 transporter family protein [Chitinophagaceae bacterium]